MEDRLSDLSIHGLVTVLVSTFEESLDKLGVQVRALTFTIDILLFKILLVGLRDGKDDLE